MSKDDYKNIKDLLAKENYRSAGSIYQNIFVKYKFYYKESTLKYNPKRDMVTTGIRYECLTLFGKLVALIGVIGIYLGLYLFILFTCILTFNFKELVDNENYKSEIAEDLWQEIFIGLPYSHKTIYNYYSFEIPNTVPLVCIKSTLDTEGIFLSSILLRSRRKSRSLKNFCMEQIMLL